MKKIILLVFIILTISGCKKIATGGSLKVRTNAEYIVIDKTKNIKDFHYRYLVAEASDDISYLYEDTINFNVGDTLILIVKRK